MTTPAAGIRISPLEERHLKRVLEIEIESQSCPWSEDSFRNEIKTDHGIFIVAEQGTDIVGFAGVWVVVDEAHIITVAVANEHRRKRIARKLVVELLLRAESVGATCSTLEVRASNEPAIKLYESLGFNAAGVRKRYYPDNKEDAVIMWKYGLGDWDPSSES